MLIANTSDKCSYEIWGEGIKSSIWSLIVPQDGQDANPYTLSISSGDEVCETIYPVQTSIQVENKTLELELAEPKLSTSYTTHFENFT